MNQVKKTCFASVVSISELQQSDIYLTVKARLFETPGANLNGVRVTDAFLDEIVEHEQTYIGLPLCADVKSLVDGNYEHLGHLYDSRTGEFHSTQIGSFYHYEKETKKNGAALIGYARVMKRNKAVCRAIAELFAAGALKFSFEITCGSYSEMEDGTVEIDADASNYLEGAAIVTFPACEDAIALELVAECNSIANDLKEEGEDMTDPIETTQEASKEIAEAVTEEIEKTASCNEEKAENKAPEAEETNEEKKNETAENETAEAQTAEVAERVEEADVCAKPEEEIEKAECKEEKKETAEKTDKEQLAELIASISKINETIAELQKVCAELTEKKEEVHVETASVTAQTVNGLACDISIAGPKYSLLESSSAPESSHYSLLDEA